VVSAALDATDDDRILLGPALPADAE
jgi:hypothetical protein